MSATPITILVVDDEIELKRLIERRFSDRIQAGEFQFIFARDGCEALAILQNQAAVDVVLTDLNMPNLDGLALLKALGDLKPTLKAVVVSAYGDMTNIRTAMNRGAFDFLTKPIDFQDLTEVLRKTATIVERERKQQKQLAAAIASLQQLAHYDALTGLPNQNAILKRIQAAIAEQQTFAVFFVRLDRLKTIEYSFGDATADRFLCQSVKHLQSYLNPDDMLARIWKDEFALFLPDVDSVAAAETRAKHLQLALQKSWRDRYFGSLHCNIGIVLSQFNYERAEDYLRAADTAMYYAQSQPDRYRCAVFNPQMQVALIERLQLESELEVALQNQNFRLDYQPILSLLTGKIVGFEALVRWHHPLKGIISPDRFIPIAEETGLILPLGNWILQQTCAQLQSWQTQSKMDRSWFISVNLSGLQLLNTDLLPYIDSLLAKYRIPGACLKLEITESVLMENTAMLTHLLQSIKDRNIQISIDDFGTGYSSLAYLQSLPINTLKIDRSFIQQMSSNRKSLDIVKTILLLACSLGLDAIAEGVESAEDVKILQALDCEFAQGYHFSPPLTPDAVINYFC
jgi:diguanylate cyclase (GGDEF)-like protein